MEDPIGSYWMQKSHKDKVCEIIRLNQELAASIAREIEITTALQNIRNCRRVYDARGIAFKALTGEKGVRHER